MALSQTLAGVPTLIFDLQAPGNTLAALTREDAPGTWIHL
jgi:hypothetical protein